MPCAFLVLRASISPDLASESERQVALFGKLRAQVAARLGAFAVPSRFVPVAALPETYSGKFMRGLLRTLLAGQKPADFSALRNPDCVDAIRATIDTGLSTVAHWRHAHWRLLLHDAPPLLPLFDLSRPGDLGTTHRTLQLPDEAVAALREVA